MRSYLGVFTGGLRSLLGKVKYCDIDQSILDGSDSSTVTVVNAIIKEWAALFPDKVFHFGADEGSRLSGLSPGFHWAVSGLSLG